jgi:hypothetical protein
MPQYVIYYEEGETNGPFSIYLSGSSGLTLYSSSVPLSQLQAGFVINFDDSIPSSSVLIDNEAYGCDTTQQLIFPSPSPTITPSISITPTISITPSITATRTPTVTPTISTTPSITPTRTITPTTTPSFTPSRSPGSSVPPSISVSITRTPSATPPAGDVSFTVTNPGTFPYPISAGNGSASGTITNNSGTTIYVYSVFNSGGQNNGSIMGDTGFVAGGVALDIPGGPITSFGQTFISTNYETLPSDNISYSWSLQKNDTYSTATLRLGYSTSPGGAITLL